MSFSVLSYNVLHSWGAARLLRGRPGGEPPWAGDRLVRVAELVRSLRPDVACLQEVDAAGQSALEHGLGEEYECAASMRNEELPPKDGCAVFIRRHKFEVVRSHSWRLRDTMERHCPGAEAIKGQSSGFAAALWRELHEKLSLALALRLRPSGGTGAEVLVATSHLFWDPRYPDLKLLQAFLLAREVERLAAGGPAVLAGDLNSTPFLEGSPGAMSGAYELLTQGRVAASHPDHPAALRPAAGILRGISPEEVPELAVAPLRSAYREAHGTEPLVTNVSRDFRGCLDYVLFGGAGIRLLGARPLPGEEELPRGSVLPSAAHPSDHLPLLAEFELPAAAP